MNDNTKFIVNEYIPAIRNSLIGDRQFLHQLAKTILGNYKVEMDDKLKFIVLHYNQISISDTKFLNKYQQPITGYPYNKTEDIIIVEIWSEFTATIDIVQIMQHLTQLNYWVTDAEEATRESRKYFKITFKRRDKKWT